MARFWNCVYTHAGIHGQRVLSRNSTSCVWHLTNEQTVPYMRRHKENVTPLAADLGSSSPPPSREEGEEDLPLILILPLSARPPCCCFLFHARLIDREEREIRGGGGGSIFS